ncbi:CPN2 [Branchiostoma lanceolatum]|uniref:CPN2 protein n=1 Tax=Branchiostoma lanceolatum TaxID=7740 RepID=A0A8J9ZTH5_BRALA|nr:CPN2 [Branchiostoma lanceolatum]
MWRALVTTVAFLVLSLSSISNVRGSVTTTAPQPWDVRCPRTYIEPCECMAKWDDFLNRQVKTVTCSGPINATSFVLPNTTESLRLANVAGLEPGMFDGADEVMVFQVNGLTSESLPADILQGMENLKFFALWFNLDLTSLPDNFFGNLRNLEKIDISETGIRVLSVDTFANLTALRTLDLARNNLENLEAGLFDDLSALSFLDLHGNNISSLPPVGNLSSLSELHLQHNSITTISPSALNTLHSLTKLDLSRNAIQTIPTGTLIQLQRLSFLDVAYNPIVTVVEDTFVGPTNLTDLGLDDHQLDTWNPEVLLNLTSLRWLHIGNVRYDWNQAMYEGGKWWFSCPPDACVFGDCNIADHQPNCTCRQGFSGDACDTPIGQNDGVATWVVVVAVTGTVVVMVVTVFGCDRFWRNRKLRYENV